MELPPEIWEKVFCYLDNPRHLEPVSLVSKQFLKLTNSLRSTLSLPNPSIHFLPSLFLRFKTLNSIDLSSFRGDPTSVLLQIARYYPYLHSLNLCNHQNIPYDAFRGIGYRMKGLKVLTLSRLGVLDDNDLVFVADCFPDLEELDISYPENSPCRRTTSVTDAGISALSLKLKNLNGIDISGNHFVTDTGVFALSINCVFLKRIAIKDCCLVTPNAIGSLLTNKPELEALSIMGIAEGSRDPFRSFEFARCLSSLECSHLYVPNQWLFMIGKCWFPLKSLVLSRSYGFSIEGLLSVLRKHRRIQHLDFEAVNFLTDDDISILSGFLSELVFVNLSSCSKLTAMAFYYVTQACPSLKEIRMERINMSKEEDSLMHVAINSQVRSLSLACNIDLSDQCLKKFVKLCPNLRFLNVSYCPKLSEEAVLLAVKSCSEISHLEINGCTKIKNLNIDFDVSNLEVLRAQGVGFDGNALAVIGKRCRNLQHLDLLGCLNVSADGVKAVVVGCKALREINLKWCSLVVDIVSWMVLSRPSLRKIVPPHRFIPSEGQRNFFLRHGCLICEGA